jgi:hypothetical protein
MQQEEEIKFQVEPEKKEKEEEEEEEEKKNINDDEENNSLIEEKKDVKDMMINIQKYDTESWTVKTHYFNKKR